MQFQAFRSRMDLVFSSGYCILYACRILLQIKTMPLQCRESPQPFATACFVASQDALFLVNTNQSAINVMNDHIIYQYESYIEKVIMTGTYILKNILAICNET